MATAQGCDTYFDYDAEYEHGWLVIWAQTLVHVKIQLVLLQSVMARLNQR